MTHKGTIGWLALIVAAVPALMLSVTAQAKEMPTQTLPKSSAADVIVLTRSPGDYDITISGRLDAHASVDLASPYHDRVPLDASGTAKVEISATLGEAKGSLATLVHAIALVVVVGPSCNSLHFGEKCLKVPG